MVSEGAESPLFRTPMPVLPVKEELVLTDQLDRLTAECQMLQLTPQAEAVALAVMLEAVDPEETLETAALVELLDQVEQLETAEQADLQDPEVRAASGTLGRAGRFSPQRHAYRNCPHGRFPSEKGLGKLHR